jgi:Galactose oxidase, central domain
MCGVQLFVHGGRSNFVLEDLYVLDFLTHSWSEVATGGRAPLPRHSHIITVHQTQTQNALYLFGGQVGTRVVASQVLC